MGNRLAQKIINSSQSVTITGLGIPSFEEYVQAQIAVHHVLSRHLPKDSLVCVQTQVENKDFTMSAHNRYYTPRYKGEDEVLDFDDTMDPLGCLKLNKPHGAAYTDDNKVLYFERHTDTSG